MLLAGSRVAFRFFRQVLPATGGDKSRRALIYGAGDAGELLLRELLNNRDLSYAPIGFIDDDPKKQGMVIHGFRVFGGNGMLGKIVSDHQIEQLHHILLVHRKRAILEIYASRGLLIPKDLQLLDNTLL